MQIERIVAIPVSIPLERPVSGGTYRVTRRCTVITRIHTSDGLVSEVHNGDDRSNGRRIAEIVEQQFQPLLLGESILARQRLWDIMFRETVNCREHATYMRAIACVDTALWDLGGKAAGRSVCELVGGARESLPIFATGGYYAENGATAGIAEEIDALKSAGMAGVKFKVGRLDPRDDALRVAAARRAAGEDFFIACDANRAWSVEQAVDFARRVEELDIAWLEEPCHWHDDARMMAAVRGAVAMPVNAGQSECTSAGVRRLLEAEAVDYVNFDSSLGGGPTEWLRAAALCRAAGVKMLHHEETVVSAHLLGGIPHGLYVDCFPDRARDPVWSGLLVDRPHVADGEILIPRAPGFGIRFDWDMVARYRI